MVSGHLLRPLPCFSRSAKLSRLMADVVFCCEPNVRVRPSSQAVLCLPLVGRSWEEYVAQGCQEAEGASREVLLPRVRTGVHLPPGTPLYAAGLWQDTQSKPAGAAAPGVSSAGQQRGAAWGGRLRGGRLQRRRRCLTGGGERGRGGPRAPILQRRQRRRRLRRHVDVRVPHWSHPQSPRKNIAISVCAGWTPSCVFSTCAAWLRAGGWTSIRPGNPPWRVQTHFDLVARRDRAEG